MAIGQFYHALLNGLAKNKLDNSTYAILEFNPYVTPNTLEVVKYYDTAEGHLKAWLSQHPANPSEPHHRLGNAICQLGGHR